MKKHTTINAALTQCGITPNNLTEAADSFTRKENKTMMTNTMIKNSIYKFALLAIFAGLFLTASVKAATITVTNNSDIGAGSLRQAILDANATAEDDTINFDASLTNQTILLTSGELNITADSGRLTINGLGADKLSVSGNMQSSVFFVNQNATAEINGITVKDGIGKSFGGLRGGGIINSGNLTLTGSTVSGNFINISRSGEGGGIYNNGTLMLSNSTVSDNSASIGGGILNRGTMMLSNSTVSGNSASGTGASSANGGGGIDNRGTVTLSNSTVSGNSATFGGGIRNVGTLSATNATVSGNSATFGGILYDGGTVNIRNSIIANSTSGGDCFNNGATINAEYSLIEDGSCGVTAGVNSNLIGDPKLGPLADNGGPTLTHALLADSPAINAGSNALAFDADNMMLMTDQRGTGFPRIVGGTVDIGAFEVQTTPPSAFNFTGFFSPIDNLNINLSKAGSSIPVKFSLGGDFGLDIFAEGYPKSSPIACDAGEPGTTIEGTVNAGGSSLTYDAATDQYSYVWKTEKSWKNTCRILVVKFTDGTEQTATFRFK